MFMLAGDPFDLRLCSGGGVGVGALAPTFHQTREQRTSQLCLHLCHVSTYNIP